MVANLVSPVPKLDPSRTVWRKSSRSGSTGCVEVAFINGQVAVRDSKDPNGPTLRFSTAAWAEFLEGVRRGDFDFMADELTAFYAAHHKSLRRYLIGQGYCAEDADDIVQDSILILREKWMRVRMMEHPKAYWFRTATRLMWLLQRRRRSFPVALDSEPQLWNLVDALDGIALVDDYRAALSMIHRLPPRQRQVLWLRAVEGFTEAETADVLSIRVGTVKSHYHDAKARLQDLMANANKPWREERQ
jgi:RNA polymerase sigma factor (sigma-70 family)